MILFILNYQERMVCSKARNHFALTALFMIYTIYTIHMSQHNNPHPPHSKKDPAGAGSNQSVPGIGVAIQKRQKLFAEHSAGVYAVELKSV